MAAWLRSYIMVHIVFIMVTMIYKSTKSDRSAPVDASHHQEKVFRRAALPPDDGIFENALDIGPFGGSGTAPDKGMPLITEHQCP